MKFKTFVTCASLVLGAGSAMAEAKTPSVTQTLLPQNSRVLFSLSSPLFSGTGELLGVSGNLASPSAGRPPSQVSLQANIRQMKFRPSKPEQAMFFETIRAALPFNVVKFESSSITEGTNGKLVVAGKAKVQGRSADVSIPVTLRRVSSTCSVVDGKYGGDADLDDVAPDAGTGLNLPISGDLTFQLRFVSQGGSCPA